MGRQDSELVVTHSSIALLQERFKQLEKMKEMREQRELLRLFPEQESKISSSSIMHYKPSSRRYCNPELSLSPSSSSSQGSPSFRPVFQNKRTDYGDVESPLSLNLWHTNRTTFRSTSYIRDNNEVDTSLHL
ncbi:hypothetical protein FRX31_005672 [Thalictrum thalictroides]|uniref:Uncharacterized protein n=1 Tax=Thalictrum thalictroides TaxID=46969 RepID=A0A7J6X848_THATH|nr:hypothetical protein FRX31_005672 [Thalictrum thalictroides]